MLDSIPFAIDRDPALRAIDAGVLDRSQRALGADRRGPENTGKRRD